MENSTITETQTLEQPWPGLVGAYAHYGGRIGAIVELCCATAYAASSDLLEQLAHDLALQIAITAPRDVGEMDSINEEGDETLLLNQRFIKDPQLSVRQLLRQTSAALGENVTVERFARFTVDVEDAE